MPKRTSLSVVRHIADADLDWITELAHQRELDVRTISPYAGERFPAPDTVEAAVVLGGPMSAVDASAHPFLALERDWIRALVEARTPVLGICLGSQLLADALGGAAQTGASGLEWGLVEVRSEAETSHPLAAALAGPAFAFHSDTFQLPPGATVLARSERYIQAWSLGAALAIQFHPEISPSGIQVLVDHEADKLAAIGIDGPEMVREAWTRERDSRDAAERIIGGWLDLPTRP